jgi:hypothetical protein
MTGNDKMNFMIWLIVGVIGPQVKEDEIKRYG